MPTFKLVADEKYAYIVRVIVDGVAIEHNQGSIRYSGNWTDHPAGHHETKDKGATAEIDFVRTIEVVGLKGRYGGAGLGYIDEQGPWDVYYAGDENPCTVFTYTAPEPELPPEHHHHHHHHHHFFHHHHHHHHY
eukprot:TRINITY_DN8697_c0_g1_i1.p1 TRINITY_DN8697_c0_g1~~TRINITY_DN8697_c0_g1_i1.p1  ORF type:complete len:152 (+),score=52.52 TRINITY_DN8697_c0_g1_i1:55-456(+)